MSDPAPPRGGPEPGDPPPARGGLEPGDPLRRDDPERPAGAGEPPGPEHDRTAAERPAARRHAAERPAAERPAGERPAPEQPLWGPSFDSPPAGGVVPPSPTWAPSAAGPPSERWVLSGWWRRVAATLIDGVIVGAGAILVLILFGAVFSVGFFAGDEAGVVSVVVGLLLASVAVAVVGLLYAPVLMARTNGQTLGKMAMHIRVVRTSGEPMTFGWAMLREVAVKALLVGALSSVTFGLAYLLDVLWPLWDEEHRALHDFLVQTRVVMA